MEGGRGRRKEGKKMQISQQYNPTTPPPPLDQIEVNHYIFEPTHARTHACMFFTHAQNNKTRERNWTVKALTTIATHPLTRFFLSTSSKQPGPQNTQ